MLEELKDFVEKKIFTQVNLTIHVRVVDNVLSYRKR